LGAKQIMLNWDPTDLLICLKVEPHADPDGVEHSYSVSQNGLRLLISIFQYDGDVYFSLFRDIPGAEPLIELKISQCPAIEFVERGGDEWLNFLPGRPPDMPFDKAASIARGIRVRIYPDICLELFK
jgi:hypothetical protein